MHVVDMSSSFAQLLHESVAVWLKVPLQEIIDLPWNVGARELVGLNPHRSCGVASVGRSSLSPFFQTRILVVVRVFSSSLLLAQID